MTVRLHLHGTTGPTVIVLHGGPAAVGEARQIARGLADCFRVLEPWQRGSSNRPLTVARHVADLHDLVLSHCPNAPPALVGESWGAMLALAYAAAHPGHVRSVALVGCGTFDKTSRAQLHRTLEERTTPELGRRLAQLPMECPDPAERMRKWAELTQPLYCFAPLSTDGDGATEPFDLQAHTQTWQDMMRLQETGEYPAAFASITAPVLMVHGIFDPHPGTMIRDTLKSYIPHLQYRELEQCGHQPWWEKWAKDAFFHTLREWLFQNGTCSG